MLILQACSDNVHLIDENIETIIVRDRVEHALPSDFLRLANGHDVLFVSGPGSFTNLRVSALVINMARRLVSVAQKLFTIDKISLYSSLVEQKILPAQWIIYIGQTKNFWLYDFVQATYRVVWIDCVPEWDFFVDQVSDRYFADLSDKKIVLGVSQQWLSIGFDGRIIAIALSSIPVFIVDIAIPEYMIEPVIG